MKKLLMASIAVIALAYSGTAMAFQSASDLDAAERARDAPAYCNSECVARQAVEAAPGYAEAQAEKKEADKQAFVQVFTLACIQSDSGTPTICECAGKRLHPVLTEAEIEALTLATVGFHYDQFAVDTASPKIDAAILSCRAVQ